MTDDDDPTRVYRRPGSGEPDGSPAAPQHHQQAGFDPEKTKVVNWDDNRDVVVPDSHTPPVDDGRTVLVGRPRRDSGVSEGDLARGWLVVVAGAGFGQSVVVGTGQNQIGRDRGNRIALPFGDQTISREKHAILTYDPKKREFWIANSQDGSNLTYLNGDAVMMPTQLSAGDEIEIGDTKLRFVPLCGADFDWGDVEDKQA